MRKMWIPMGLALIAAPALGHDFWLQPVRFVLDAPSMVPISMFVGHGQARDRWGVAADHIKEFKSRGPDGLVDRMRDLRMGGKSYDARVLLAQPGSYVFGLQSASADSQLPAVRFNDYVKAEGITPIAEYRRRNRLERSDGREVYSRRAKAIVQVGAVDAASISRVTKPLGLRLEIIPEQHPLTLDAGDKLPVRVLFRGRPLAGALVKLTDLAADAIPVATQRTSAKGKAVFSIPRAGNWQMNVIWAEPLGNKSNADFDTTFSSLSFATD